MTEATPTELTWTTTYRPNQGFLGVRYVTTVYEDGNPYSVARGYGITKGGSLKDARRSVSALYDAKEVATGTLQLS